MLRGLRGRVRHGSALFSFGPRFGPRIRPETVPTQKLFSIENTPPSESSSFSLGSSCLRSRLNEA